MSLPHSTARDCLTCGSHNHLGSLDDIAPSCWDCSTKADRPRWRPIEVTRRVQVDAPAEASGDPLKTQEGGAHYKALKIQPIEYAHANGLPFAEGNIIKYVTRWRSKGGLQDLRKAVHMLELLIKLESEQTPIAK